MDFFLITPRSETELASNSSINTSFSKPLISERYESFSDELKETITPDLKPTAPDENLIHIDHIDIIEPKDDSLEGKNFRRWMFLRAIIAEFIATMIFLISRWYCDAKCGSMWFCCYCYDIFICSEISGAHFNPAVTFATWLAGKVSNRKALFFIIAQLAGSIVASAILLLVFPADLLSTVVAKPNPNVSLYKAFFMEVLLTFILVFTVFTTAFELIPQKAAYSKVKADDKGLTLYSVSPQSKAGFAPLAIGFTVAVLSMLGGNISGGAFNPARVFGCALLTGNPDYQWLYWTADMLGAGLAVGMRQTYWYYFTPIKNI